MGSQILVSPAGEDVGPCGAAARTAGVGIYHHIVLKTIFFQLIVHSHAIMRSNTESPHTLHPVSSNSDIVHERGDYGTRS